MEDKMKKQIIQNAEKEFLDSDKQEPFLDRRYVEEINRIFELLKSGDGDFENASDRAIYDIVTDIIKKAREI